jgi:hypothetical protein
VPHLRRFGRKAPCRPSGTPNSLGRSPSTSCWAKVFGVPPGLGTLILGGAPSTSCWAEVFGVPPGLETLILGGAPSTLCWAKVFGVPPGLETLWGFYPALCAGLKSSASPLGLESLSWAVHLDRKSCAKLGRSGAVRCCAPTLKGIRRRLGGRWLRLGRGPALLPGAFCCVCVLARRL